MDYDPLENQTAAAETFDPVATPKPDREAKASGTPSPAADKKPAKPRKRRTRGAVASLTPPPGDRLAIAADAEGNWFGKYRVLNRLGAGGMGDVWLVEHVGLDLKRALKIIKADLADSNPSNRLRFQQEAKILAQLSKHPNAVEVHDFGMVGEHAYIEMDHLPGQTLDKWLKTKAGVPPPLDDVLWLLGELCDVMGEAHKLHIVHRDIKPPNIMIVPDPSSKRGERVKVLDFGIAKIVRQVGADTNSLTMHTKGYLGTVYYSSPEQLGWSDDGGGEEVRIDHRSDIYSIGVMLYEMLSGNRPFTGNLHKIMYDHVHTPPPPFAKRSPGVQVPPAVEKVVMHCLEKSPEKRPQSAQELYELFRDAVPKPEPRREKSRPSPSENQSVVTRIDTSSDLFPDKPSLFTQIGLPRSLPRRAILGLFLSLALVTGVVSGGLVLYLSPMVKTQSRPEVRGWVKDYLKSRDFEPVVGTDVDKSGWPEKIRRISDNSSMTMIKRGDLYLPEQVEYTPQSDSGTNDAGLPLVLIRQKDGVKFHLIEEGEFRMGHGVEHNDKCADDQQKGYLAKLSSYYMQEYEVTNKEIQDLWGNHPVEDPQIKKFWTAKDELREEMKQEQWEKHPAVGLSRRLAEQHAHLVGGELPTEQQWEFAARSRGQREPYVWPGDEPRDKKGEFKAHVSSNRFGARVVDTREVDLERYIEDRTEQGVFGLAGNVREWCRDAWRCYPKAVNQVDYWTRPEFGGPDPSTFVIRGGSFRTPPETSKVTYRSDIPGDADVRYQAEEEKSFEDVGFRVVLEVVVKRPPPPTASGANRPKEGLP